MMRQDDGQCFNVPIPLDYTFDGVSIADIRVVIRFGPPFLLGPESGMKNELKEKCLTAEAVETLQRGIVNTAHRNAKRSPHGNQKGQD